MHLERVQNFQFQATSITAFAALKGSAGYNQDHDTVQDGEKRPETSPVKAGNKHRMGLSAFVRNESMADYTVSRTLHDGGYQSTGWQREAAQPPSVTQKTTSVVARNEPRISKGIDEKSIRVSET